MKPMTARPLLEIHIAVFFFGLAGLFGKWLNSPPGFIVLGRTAIASCALLSIIIGLKQWQRPKHWGMIVTMGALLAVHWVAFFQSIQLATVAIGLLTFSTFPAFVALLEPWVFKQKFKWMDLILGSVILMGVALIVPQWNLENPASLGTLWGLFSGFSFAVLAILNKSQVHHTPPLIIAALQNGFAALFLLPFVFSHIETVSMATLGKLAFLGICCTALAHWLFIRSLKTLRAQLVSLITALEPVYGVIFAFIFLKEIPSVRTLLGGTLIIGTIIFATRKRGQSGTASAG